MSSIRAVIFDFYGTLADILTDEDKDEIFNRLAGYLQYFGGRVTPGELKSLYQVASDRYRQTRAEKYAEFDMLAVFGSVLKKLELNDPLLAESCCKLLRLISRERFQLFPDSQPAVAELKGNAYPLAILSNAQNVFFHAEVDMLGLTPFFNYTLVSSYFGFRKPDPRFFALGCAILGYAPAETVYIGNDTMNDIKGAKEAGLRTVLIDRQQKEKDREPKPEFYTTDLREASRWIIQQRG